LAGYVEATRDDDGERNRICPPNGFPDTLAEWARMQARGATATAAFGAEPDIAEWANRCELNPAAVDPSRAHDPELQRVRHRLAEHAAAGLAQLAGLAHERG
jgi:hypothetical protein